jgi:hypothetical protein
MKKGLWVVVLLAAVSARSVWSAEAPKGDPKADLKPEARYQVEQLTDEALDKRLVQLEADTPKIIEFNKVSVEKAAEFDRKFLGEFKLHVAELKKLPMEKRAAARRTFNEKKDAERRALGDQLRVERQRLGLPVGPVGVGPTSGGTGAGPRPGGKPDAKPEAKPAAKPEAKPAAKPEAKPAAK